MLSTKSSHSCTAMNWGSLPDQQRYCWTEFGGKTGLPYRKEAMAESSRSVEVERLGFKPMNVKPNEIQAALGQAAPPFGVSLHERQHVRLDHYCQDEREWNDAIPDESASVNHLLDCQTIGVQ